jgi:hypothetical protein
VVTVTGVEVPAQGHDDQILHRNPVAVLAGVLDDRELLGVPVRALDRD